MLRAIRFAPADADSSNAMEILSAGWLGLGLVVALVWLSRHIDIARARREVSLGSHMNVDPPDPAPRVSVVVAARDEESVILRCVRSVLSQEYPDFELIVVNDRSGDRTGAILDEQSRESPDKMRVVHVSQLPAGWFGKPNAVQSGVDIARGDYYVFTDADCELDSPHTLAITTRYAIENDIDFLSVLPVVEPSCPTEAIAQPVCSAVLMIWHPLAKVNDPSHPSAYANGAFMLIRREAYERIGGHRSVRNVVCEDLQLARNAKAAGVHLHVVQNRDLYHTQMYDSFDQVWRGWSRIFQGAFQRPRRVLLAMLILFVFSLMPWISLVAIITALAQQGWSQPWTGLFVVWLAAAAAQQSLTLRLYPLMRAPRRRSVSYFAGAVLCFAILADALLKLLGIGKTSWRGTTYAARSAQQGSESTLEDSSTHAR